MTTCLAHMPCCDRDMRKVLNCEVVRLHTKPIRGGGGNTQIIAAWIPYKTVVPTMLFSHGNAVDLGQMLPFYRFPPHLGHSPEQVPSILSVGMKYVSNCYIGLYTYVQITWLPIPAWC